MWPVKPGLEEFSYGGGDAMMSSGWNGLTSQSNASNREKNGKLLFLLTGGSEGKKQVSFSLAWLAFQRCLGAKQDHRISVGFAILFCEQILQGRMIREMMSWIRLGIDQNLSMQRLYSQSSFLG
ncbi:hypothetical protein Tco_0276115 [Tanacetum coccineum]